MTKRTFILPLALLLSACTQFTVSAAPGQLLSLEGRWRFQLDRNDAGVGERWFARTLPDSIKLPGGLTEQGLGDPVSVDTKWMGGIVDKSWFTAPEFAKYREPGNVKVPFWLQPERYYAGAAWFQRDLEIPQAWTNRRVVLFLERPHWETRVWVDGRCFGTNTALATPHEYDLGQLPPGKHTLTLRVDNRMIVDVGENSHSVSDHTQGNWNGIVGRIELRSTAPVWIEDLQVYPHLARESVTLRGRIGNTTGQAGQGTLAVRLGEPVEHGFLPPPPRVKFPVSWQADGGTFECEVHASSPKPWDEFHPQLYYAEARIEETQDFMEAKVARFGFRDFSTQGTQFLINGQKTFLRGTLECCIFPKTGHPPTDRESWQRILKVARAHGLNLLRFHSWCPPEAAFDVADELGFYFHVECSSWANQSTTIGDGKPIDRWIYEEADRILKHYGNHPSFVLMPYGNEPGGPKHVPFLAKWVEHYRAQDPRRLYTSGSGWPQIKENQFHVTPDPRIQAWGEGLKSRINARPPETTTDYRDYITRREVPVISHEIGQWCVYPNFEEMKKYTGYLKARNFEIFRDRLQANGLGKLDQQFLLASGKLQALCYKEDIESALRTPGMGGFELLDLHDFPGQGTALVGVLDSFWEEKGYISPREYSRFCNATVPLARLPQRVFTSNDRLTAQLEVAHFGAEPIRDAVLEWKL
ncbi:MAG TPA: glycoside hydrolase family 2 TIM barrel-domain containing protein, partial [Bacillota bacterium]|nr:glycoside hydrolase family 2 TIM barrel-domain containing protein [Bacillota bacterium]